MTSISVSTKKREELVDITGPIQEVLKEKNWEKGILFMFVPHTTAGITVNENYDPAVGEDISDCLKGLAPPRGPYKHTEGNADSHIKSAIVGQSGFIFVDRGKPVFGTWQGIFLCEFDGPRQRKIYLRFFREIE